MADDAVAARMQALIQEWEQASDQRGIFLNCYLMMTRNMRIAVEQGEFFDPLWVDHLVDHFAGYYFVALEVYEQDPSAAPRVWQQAHQATQDPEILTLQKLLLGVNAHINYDLVLSMVDMLGPEWADLSEEQRARRYADYCHVNEVIGCTIDAVQDQVVEPAMPVIDLIDRLFGPLDEKMISGLLARWRENVWRYAVQLLEAEEEQAYARLIGEVEQSAIRTGDFISLKRG